MTDNLLNNDDANKSTKSSEVLDFAQALFHSAVEKPFNGVVQIVNKSTNAGLPELDVVGASRTDSLGTSAGNLAGTLIDYAIPSNLANDIGSYAAFGAAFGALGYAASKFGPENTTKDFIGTKTYNNGDTAPVKGQLTLDADGKPIQFSGELPPADPYAGGRLRFESTKLMNGSWKTTSPDDYIFVIPKITDVQFDAKAGTLNLVDAIGDNRLFGNDGVYTISNPVADAKAAADVAKWNERIRQVYEDSLDRVTNGERKNH